jgi:uncharacterized protein HemX
MAELIELNMLLNLLNNINDAVTIMGIISTILIGTNGWLFYKQNKLKKQQEANADMINNEAKQSEEWRKLYIDSKQELKEKEAKIDELYAKISNLRDKEEDLREALAKFEVKYVKDEIKLCNRKKCMDREPQTGY